jgi:hypothetical protein
MNTARTEPIEAKYFHAAADLCRYVSMGFFVAVAVFLYRTSDLLPLYGIVVASATTLASQFLRGKQNDQREQRRETFELQMKHANTDAKEGRDDTRERLQEIKATAATDSTAARTAVTDATAHDTWERSRATASDERREEERKEKLNAP